MPELLASCVKKLGLRLQQAHDFEFKLWLDGCTRVADVEDLREGDECEMEIVPCIEIKEEPVDEQDAEEKEDQDEDEGEDEDEDEIEQEVVVEAPRPRTRVLFTSAVPSIPQNRPPVSEKIKIDVVINRKDSFDLLEYVVGRRDKLEPFIEALRKRFTLPAPEHIRILWCGYRMDPGATFGQFNIEDGDTIDITESQCGGKPVILLYPQEDNTPVHVELQLSSAWDLCAVYPLGSLQQTFHQHGNTKQLQQLEQRYVAWSVIANACGALTDQSTQHQCDYLFWEALTNGSALFTLDLDEAFCVPRTTVATFLNDALERYGLTRRERNDCVTYWLHQLEASPWVLLQFIDQRTYNAAAQLTITPTPTTLIRVFFVFKGVQEQHHACKGKLPETRPERRGFVAVEWGGMNLSK